MVQQRDEQLGKAQRRVMAQLLEVGKVDSATIRVENIIRSDITTELHEILELYCELLLARSGLMEAPTCDPGLEEAVQSIIYATPKTEIKELLTVRNLLAEKYGKEYVVAAMENADGKVNEKVIKKLSVEPPRRELVQGYLEEIAKAYGVDWPKRGRVSPPPSDLLSFDKEGGGGEGNNTSGGQGEDAEAEAEASKLRPAREEEQLSRATPPQDIGGPKSPLTVTPPRMTTENVHPRVTLNSMELKPSKKMEEAAAGGAKRQNGAQKEPDGSVPDIGDLERRFAALKKR